MAFVQFRNEEMKLFHSERMTRTSSIKLTRANRKRIVHHKGPTYASEMNQFIEIKDTCDWCLKSRIMFERNKKNERHVYSGNSRLNISAIILIHFRRKWR